MFESVSLGQLVFHPSAGHRWRAAALSVQAIRAPGRVASITLLDPAGPTRLDARFWWWLTISGLATLTPMPIRRRLARWLDSPAMLEPELMTLLWAAAFIKAHAAGKQAAQTDTAVGN